MRARDIMSGWIGCLMVAAAAVSAQPAGESAQADPDFMVQIWRTSEGLPANVILELEQTPDGYLWLGTTHGLVRFDGSRFATYLSTRLPHRFGTRIEALDVDHSGRLWIVAEQEGLLAYQDRHFTEYHTNGEVLNLPTASVCSDAAGQVWVLDARGRLARMPVRHPEQIEPVDFKLPSGTRLLRDGRGNVWASAPRNISGIVAGQWTTVLRSPVELQAVAGGREGGLWLATEEQLQRLSPGGQVTALEDFPWQTGATRVTCLYEDAQGALWVGTSSQGLFQRANGQFKSVMTVPRAINCIRQDTENNLWVGTRGGGLARVRKRVFRMLDSRSGLANEYINGLAEDHLGRIWLATEENGLGRFEAGGWQPVGRSEGWPGMNVFCLAPTRDHGLWLGTARQGWWRWQGGQYHRVGFEPPLPAAPPRCVLEARDGTLWMVLGDVAVFSATQGKTRRHGPVNGLNTRRVRTLTEDGAGGIWAGDWHGGLWRFEGEEWLEMRAPTSSAEAVRALVFDDEGALWVGTAGAGLLRWHAGQVARVGAQQGLPTEDIEQMLLHEDRFWLGTDKGLFRVNLDQLQDTARGRRERVEAIHHGPGDGLLALHFTGRYQPRSVRTRDGELWFATANGAVCFRPSDLPTNGPPPQALIEEVLANGQTQPAAKSLHLHSDARRVEFRFSAPHFTAPERVRFRYQLVGTDDTWVECGTERSAIYAGVPFGRHYFRVAAGVGGVWGPPSEALTLIMQPHFWQTQWFIAAMSAVFAGGLAWSVRKITVRRLNHKLKRLEQEHAFERERGRISQDIHDELGANLTTIGLLADMGERHKTNPEALTRDLTQISATARATARAMDAIVWAVNPQNDSLDHFANYVGQFARDFFRPTAIRTRLDVPTTLPAHPMSAQVRHNLFLAIKEALNNVARHAEATEVRLALHMTDNVVRVTVEDNGRGLPAGQRAEGQDGLANMRSRLEKHGGTFLIEPAPGGGTRLVFSVPLPKLNSD